jgi:hypothetical protein
MSTKLGQDVVVIGELAHISDEPDRSAVVADDRGGFTLPDRAYGARDAPGTVTLGRGTGCLADSAGVVFARAEAR